MWSKAPCLKKNPGIRTQESCTLTTTPPYAHRYVTGTLQILPECSIFVNTLNCILTIAIQRTKLLNQIGLFSLLLKCYCLVRCLVMVIKFGEFCQQNG